MKSIDDFNNYTQLPFEIIPIERGNDGHISVPVYFFEARLLQPNSRRAADTLSKVIRHHHQYEWTRTTHHAEAYTLACKTHNNLIAGVRYGLRFEITSPNKKMPWGKSFEDTSIYLLEFINENGPRVTLLFQPSWKNLEPIYLSMKILDECYAKCLHPSDKLSLAAASRHLFDARDRLLRSTKQLVA